MLYICNMHSKDELNAAMREALKRVIREERDRSRMSLRELADASGVNYSLIQRIESGSQRTYADVIPSLALAFGMGPIDLFAAVYVRARQILDLS